jgi:hypothetical protein
MASACLPFIASSMKIGELRGYTAWQSHKKLVKKWK